VTSPPTLDYNCVAWVAGDTTRWWWPDPDAHNDTSYWPPGVSEEETVEAFAAAFTTLGYAPASDDALEPGFEKLALFAAGGTPTHLARQLPNGRWTSKLGRREDIEHELQALCGDIYGKVVLVMRRLTKGSTP
jgi:hypothetical protein